MLPEQYSADEMVRSARVLEVGSGFVHCAGVAHALSSEWPKSLYCELKHTPGMARYLESSNVEGRRLHCQLSAGVLPLCDASRLWLVSRHNISRKCFMCLNGAEPALYLLSPLCWLTCAVLEVVR